MEERLGTVYLIKCMMGGKGYYGFTMLDDPWDRIKQHQYNANRGRQGRLYSAIRKYGWDNFMICWLHYKSLPERKCKSYEAFYVLANDAMNPQKGYNMTEGGRAPSHCEETKNKIRESSTGRTHTEKSKKKISENNSRGMLGRKHTEESRQKMSKAWETREVPPFYGKKHTDESRKKISDGLKGENHPMFGLNHTEESKLKMSESSKGIIPREESRQKMSLSQTKRRIREAKARSDPRQTSFL